MPLLYTVHFLTNKSPFADFFKKVSSFIHLSVLEILIFKNTHIAYGFIKKAVAHVSTVR